MLHGTGQVITDSVQAGRVLQASRERARVREMTLTRKNRTYGASGRF
jgi:hypothetical protein